MRKYLKISFVLIILMGVFNGVGFAKDDIQIFGDYTIEAGDHIESDVTIINGDLILNGEVIGEINVVNGNAYINGKVTGEISVVNGNVTLNKNGYIDGNVNIVRGQLKRNGGVITGKIDRIGINLPKFKFNGTTNNTFDFAAIYMKIVFLLITIGLGIVFIYLSPKFYLRAEKTFVEHFILSFFIGFLSYIVFIPLELILFITIVGIPFAIFFVPVVYYILYAGGLTIGIHLVGKAFFGKYIKDKYYLIIVGAISLIVLKIAIDLTIVADIAYISKLIALTLKPILYGILLFLSTTGVGSIIIAHSERSKERKYAKYRIKIKMEDEKRYKSNYEDVEEEMPKDNINTHRKENSDNKNDDDIDKSLKNILPLNKNPFDPMSDDDVNDHNKQK